jgi:putative FmdB family regulatory protein
VPTYDYKCNACSHVFEQFQSIKDKPLKVCPECGKKALERLIGTGGAIIFKGGGFYQTDYRSESYKKAAEADKAPAAGAASAGEAKVEKASSSDSAKNAAGAGEKASPKSEKKQESKPKAKRKVD